MSIPCLTFRRMNRPSARKRGLAARSGVVAVLALAAGFSAAQVSAAEADDSWSIQGQTTLVEQAHTAFRSPYSGQNSLAAAALGRETFDATLFIGFKPWSGAEVWIDPEIDQGFGLSDTLGVAAFPSGEAYKVGASTPYPKLQRMFLRQTLDLGGATVSVDADQNQFAGAHAADRVVLWAGKLSVADVFDTNRYAHDPRRDFLNWAVIDTGSFDYAANAWGYTLGAAAELYRSAWAVRLGLFDLSTVPNSVRLDPTFHQFQTVAEIERQTQIGGQAGTIRITAFASHGRMAQFADALAAATPGTPPSLAAARRDHTRAGASLDFEQSITDAVGGFLRAGLADGRYESFEFTDIDRTLSGGLSLKGSAWGREADHVGIAASLNDISSTHRQFLAAGGLGILVGDGRLPHPGPESVLEAYYDAALTRAAALTLDLQWVNNPGFNRDRGPVPLGAVRMHFDF